DPRVPLTAEVTGWSPFEPGDADAASLPVAALEYRFHNPTSERIEAVFSWNARNFLAARHGSESVRAVPGGFVLWAAGAPDGRWAEASFGVRGGAPLAGVNGGWFRGAWFAPLTLAWRDVVAAACYARPAPAAGNPAPGASLFVPIALDPGAETRIALRLSWY